MVLLCRISILIIVLFGPTPKILGLGDRKSEDGDLNSAGSNIVNGLYGHEESSFLNTAEMEALQLKNMVEHKVHLAMDGLKERQPMEIRSESILSLILISRSPMAKKILSNSRMAKPIVDAVMNLNCDDTPTNLAALALYYILASNIEQNREKELLGHLDFVVAKEMEKIRLAHIKKEDGQQLKCDNCNPTNGEINDVIDPSNSRSKEPFRQVLEKEKEMVANRRCKHSAKRNAWIQVNKDRVGDIISYIGLIIMILYALAVLYVAFIVLRDEARNPRSLPPGCIHARWVNVR